MPILAIYQEAAPNFPATDQQPGAKRYQIGDLWVDAIGPKPNAGDVAAFLAPDPNYSIPKDLPWRRATDAEAVTLEALLAATTPRLRQIYNASLSLSTGDELFETMKSGMAASSIGAARADELLAREA